MNAQLVPPHPLTGGLDRESESGRSLRHALVIGNQPFQVDAKPLRRRKVDRIERAQYSGVQSRRGVQQSVVQTYEMNPVKNQLCSAQRPGSEMTNGPRHLGSRKRARDSVAITPQEVAQRLRFGLAHNQFHHRGGVKVDHRV